MVRVIIALLFAFSNILCFADYSDRGRPSDFQDHHDGPLTYIFMGVGAIIVVAIICFWIYDKIRTHKKEISDTFGTIFAGLLIFGGILLFGKCGETLHNSINSKENNTDRIESTENSGPSKSATPSHNAPVYQYTPPKPNPTLRYRTVEYYENCYNCGGTGRVVCPRCNGTGHYKKTCSRCNGSGGHYRSRCVYCNGKGYEEDLTFGTGRHSCIACGGTGYVDNNCQWCSGSGYESETCDIYAAAGQSTHMVVCTVCNGNGRIRRTKQESYYE